MNIHLPVDWILRRLETAQQGLDSRAIEVLARHIDSGSDTLPVLPAQLALSYFPERISALASELGEDPDGLLDRVVSDLRRGATLRPRAGSDEDASRIVYIDSAEWHLVVQRSTGKKSGLPIALATRISPAGSRSRPPRFRPEGVSFAPIWEETQCDLALIVEAQRKFDHATKVLYASHDKLRIPLRDDATETQRVLHVAARKQYGALRSMLGLLRLRSEQGQESFKAKLRASDLIGANHVAQEARLATPDPRIRLEFSADASAPHIEEGAMLELESLGGRRCRVLAVEQGDESVSLETDLALGSHEPGQIITGKVLSRFSMRAHLRALQAFLRGEAAGRWDHLARLLCDPATLEPLEHRKPPSSFFCDLDERGPSLNERQRAAVVGAMTTEHAFCIQGPPGTGKSTVICELVQQLIARGEQVLLTAPTHVAVDEVLRRIGDHDGVRALRLSWDEERVGEETRRFLPNRILDPFLGQSPAMTGERQTRWAAEISACENAAERLSVLEDARTTCGDLQRAFESDRAVAESAEDELGRRGPGLEAEIAQLKKEIALAKDSIPGLEAAATAADDALARHRKSSGLGERILGWLGMGEIRRLSNLQAKARKNLVARLSRESELQQRMKDRVSVLRSLRNTAAETAAKRDGGAKELEDTRRALRAALAATRENVLLRDVELDADSIEAAQDFTRRRGQRLKAYKTLSASFDEVLEEFGGRPQCTDALRSDLVQTANLVCSTTTGLGGSKELQSVTFDTVILDEASRVTDSEFLIAATKARRWILVGDEHQLPPYVDGSDEHFLHALSALHTAESGRSSLEEAVDALGKMWKEDEEQHRFRDQEVLRVAGELQATGDWQGTYRAEFQQAAGYLAKEHEDTSRALLTSMRAHLVRSLFERVVLSIRPELRCRLVEQRRMIGPLARIVSDPVYGGDYVTPDESQLAARGVTPLTTPTFPKPITFLDTSAFRKKARDSMRGNGFVNEKEAAWIIEACEVLDRELSDMGSGPITVSILTFYKAQARLIGEQIRVRERRSGAYHCLSFRVIDSIDKIQGQESDVVFLSFCRTAGKTVSSRFGLWLQDLRRLNVACTRAHRALIFVGQKELLTKLCGTEDAQRFYSHLDRLFKEHPEWMERKVEIGSRGSA